LDTRAQGGRPRRAGPVDHRYRVHMAQSVHDADLYRLNTDVWLE